MLSQVVVGLLEDGKIDRLLSHESLEPRVLDLQFLEPSRLVGHLVSHNGEPISEVEITRCAPVEWVRFRSR